MQRELITLGAEAKIEKVIIWGEEYIQKTRPEKPYLLPAIDIMLRKNRTGRECKVLSLARSFGIPTPAVHSIDMSNFIILMDFIDGKQLKEIAIEAPMSELELLCKEFGSSLALLHKGDVVHGDPTTSNIIVQSSSKLWMIDFGLAELNATIEMKGVDLHLVKRAFETTHWNRQDKMLQMTIEGYVSVMKDDAEPILYRMDEIRERGRYH